MTLRLFTVNTNLFLFNEVKSIDFNKIEQAQKLAREWKPEKH